MGFGPWTAGQRHRLRDCYYRTQSVLKPEAACGAYRQPLLSRIWRIVGCLIAFATLIPFVAAADPVAVASSIRTTGCDGKARVGAKFHPVQKLNAAAERIARGQSLADAVLGAGYHSLSTVVIHVDAAGGDAAVEKILRQRFCNHLSNPQLTDIGIASRGQQTWIVLAQPFVPPSPSAHAEVSQRVLALVNAARSQARRCGRDSMRAVPPVALNAVLARAATLHAQDMARRRKLTHDGADGSTPADRATRAGYRWRTIGENVAVGPPTAEEVVQGWIDSPGHCVNLMNPAFTEMGIGYAVEQQSEAGIYWAQEFAAPR